MKIKTFSGVVLVCGGMDEHKATEVGVNLWLQMGVAGGNIAMCFFGPGARAEGTARRLCPANTTFVSFAETSWCGGPLSASQFIKDELRGQRGVVLVIVDGETAHWSSPAPHEVAAPLIVGWTKWGETVRDLPLSPLRGDFLVIPVNDGEAGEWGTLDFLPNPPE